MDDDLLELLAQELGEIYRWEEGCPGIYYLAALSNAEFANEYYIVLDNGIYWLETERCIHVLTVCNPVWTSELSEGLLKPAGKLAHEDELGCCAKSGKG